jgi:hypothetical protein
MINNYNIDKFIKIVLYLQNKKYNLVLKNKLKNYKIV